MSDKPTYNGLRAVYFNTTLKRSPQKSNTEGLINLSSTLMRENGVAVDVIRTVDRDIAPGVYPDMTEYGFEVDEWPEIQKMVLAADILIIAGPIWLGDNSSETKKVIERLYASSGELNHKNQSVYYGRTGGCLLTGNEDGVKHCAMNILYSLQHIGYVIPPQADAGWLGEIGPGPSYLDEGSGGPENDFTNKNTTFMTWNLMHIAAFLKQNQGIPSYGNDRKAWSEGNKFGLKPFA